MSLVWAWHPREDKAPEASTTCGELVEMYRLQGKGGKEEEDEKSGS